MEHEDIAPKRTKKEASNSAGSRVRSNGVQNAGNQEHRRPSHAKGKPRNTQLDHPQPAKKESSAKVKAAQDKSGLAQGSEEASVKGGKKGNKPKRDWSEHAQDLHVAPLQAVQVSKNPDLGGITENPTAPQSQRSIADQLTQRLGSHGQRSQSLVMVNHVTLPINERHISRSQVNGPDTSAASRTIYS